MAFVNRGNRIGTDLEVLRILERAADAGPQPITVDGLERRGFHRAEPAERGDWLTLDGGGVLVWRERSRHVWRIRISGFVGSRIVRTLGVLDALLAFRDAGRRLWRHEGKPERRKGAACRC